MPIDKPEADGTFAWVVTTLNVIHAEGRGATGFGCTYADASNVFLIEGMLAEAVAGVDAVDPPWASTAMRNVER